MPADDRLLLGLVLNDATFAEAARMLKVHRGTVARRVVALRVILRKLGEEALLSLDQAAVQTTDTEESPYIT